MFPNQRTSILSFQQNDNEGGQNVENNDLDKIWMDYDGGLDGLGALNTQDNTRKGGRDRKSSTSFANNASNVDGSSSNNNAKKYDDQQKKMFHREVERLRRQEMSELFASLRSTLPADYIKGKRTTSDHLAEAVNYIKDLENNVKELGDKREQLKTSIETTISKLESDIGGSRHSTPCPGTVVVLPRLGGFDIEINVGYDDEGFSLSIALQVIHDYGLGVASYTSTKIDDRLVHKIVCEVDDMACIDIDGLHQRLIFLVY